jgi:uncharacterized protein YjbI with pentapeptide repeats
MIDWQQHPLGFETKVTPPYESTPGWLAPGGVDVRGSVPPGPFHFERQTWGGEGRWSTASSYRLYNVIARGAQFNLDAVGFFAEGSEFVDCTFSQTPAVTKSNLKKHNYMLTDGRFGWNERSTYRGCTFDHLDFRARGGGMAPGEATFEGCTFSYCSFQHFTPMRADFIDCTFVGTITSAMFWGDSPRAAAEPQRRNTFTGNDFTRAKLRRVAFRTGIDLNTCLLPEGPEYFRLQGFLSKAERARVEIGAWTVEQRQRAQVFLDYYEEDRQDLLFVWRRSVDKFDAVYALLEAMDEDPDISAR